MIERYRSSSVTKEHPRKKRKKPLVYHERKFVPIPREEKRAASPSKRVPRTARAAGLELRRSQTIVDRQHRYFDSLVERFGPEAACHSVANYVNAGIEWWIEHLGRQDAYNVFQQVLDDLAFPKPEPEPEEEDA